MKTLRPFIPILLILAAPVAMLYPLWSNPVCAGEDDVLYYYPVRKMVGRALRAGRWPVSAGAEAGGTPLMADPQTAVMYPPTWLFAVMAPRPAYAMSILLAFWLAGGGAYLYLRGVGLLRVAATFGAVAFMFCGFMVAHRVHLSMIHTGAFLPWGLWGIEKLRGRPRGAFAVLVPVFVAAAAAGHWPTLIQMSVVWGAYLLLRARPLFRSLLVPAAAGVLAAVILAPQLLAALDLMGQVTRRRIGYAAAGENSFFPLAGVLAMFPMLMGSRTPNFFPQTWWGPWHLCEMLGYAGLVTLVLAGAAVWRLNGRRNVEAACAPGGVRLAPMVRVWTWLGAAAGIWMLGYYLPTYRLIHALPVLSSVRCPARMVLAVDLALAALAAMAVHALVGQAGAGADRLRRLASAVRRAALRVLPIAMLAAVGLLAAAAGVAKWLWGGWPPGLSFFAGGPEEAMAALTPTNPAVWVPLATLAATAAAVRFWLGAPRRRAAVLVAVLLADLFFLTRFVDVPGGQSVRPGPDTSPAATWLKAYRGPSAGDDFRVWGLAADYFDRPAELLLPMTCRPLGIRSIAGYGPFQSPSHAHLFGFRPWGVSRNWAWLLRRNHLLSLYNVRYVLAAESEFREVIESVRVPARPRAPDGPNLLAAQWDAVRAEVRDGRLRLRTPVMWLWSRARQPISLEAGRVYRIGLDARGPDGGAANFLRADVFREFDDGGYADDEALALIVSAEQIGGDWRHFEWTFRAPQDLPERVSFRVFTQSERPIEVRNVSLRTSHWPVPVVGGGRLAPGERVYEKLAELPALRPSEPPVAIYENRLCRPAVEAPAEPGAIEALKWADAVPAGPVPAVFLRAGAWPGNALTSVLVCVTLPGGILYSAVVVAGWAFARRRAARRKRGEPSRG